MRINSSPSLPAASPAAPASAPADALVATARSLQRDPTANQRLAGRNLALLCADDHPDAPVFLAAGAALGARVARLQHHARDAERPRELRRIGDALGHLYDAVECLGLPVAATASLREAAGGMPVFDGISSTSHATAPLADQLDNDLPHEVRRSLIVQAILLQTLR
jgi:ornithine carbamoyltransferase